MHTHFPFGRLDINHTSWILNVWKLPLGKAEFWCNSSMWGDVASQLMTCVCAIVSGSVV